jgi:hypothetical protein
LIRVNTIYAKKRYAAYRHHAHAVHVRCATRVAGGARRRTVSSMSLRDMSGAMRARYDIRPDGALLGKWRKDIHARPANRCPARYYSGASLSDE